MATIDLRKKIRVHEALSEALSAMPLKELDYETLFFLLAKLSKKHTDETTYDLNMSEFEALTGSKQQITHYTACFKRLRAITLEIETDKSILIDGVIHSAELMKGLGTVQVKLSPKMKPYLLSLTENYTEHQLFSIIRLRSKHSKKLYLHFCNFRPRNGVLRTVIDYQTIEEFRLKLGYENYELNGNFINRVLKVAKDEINEVSNLRVSYKLKKRGHEYYWIEWIIENKGNEELIKLDPFSPMLAIEEKGFDGVALVIRLKEEYGLSDHQADKVARMIDKDKLEESLAKVDEAKKNKAIKKTLGGYTRSVLIADFGTDLNI